MTLGLFPYLCISLRKVIIDWLARKRGCGGLRRVGPQPGVAQPWILAALSSNRCEQLPLQCREPGVMLQGCRGCDRCCICSPGAGLSGCPYGFRSPSQQGHASLLRKEPSPSERPGKQTRGFAGAVPALSWEAVEPRYRISSSQLIVEGASQALRNQLLCVTKSLG